MYGRYGYNAIYGGGSPTGAAEQAAVRQDTGVPLTTSDISGDEAIVRYGGSCQAAAGSSCCQVTVAGCGSACLALGGAKHRSVSITGSCPPPQLSPLVSCNTSRRRIN